jgi:xylulose-5-phosphate/fructose-6-phosphate phosphoketolase
MGANPHANGGLLLKDLLMPDFRKHAIDVPAPGTVETADTRVLGEFFRDVAKQNQHSVWDHCLRSRNYVNVVIAGKYKAPQWLSMDEAIKHCTAGIGKWYWASNDGDSEPDVVMACCGDVPTLETLAAVSILGENMPELKVRVVNVVDLMKLQPASEHPHGLSDENFDALFTQNKPIIFAFHGYPSLIHQLTYRRTNHKNMHVRGYKEEGTITTTFDMTVLNDLDRFHLVMDTIDRLPQTGANGVRLKKQLTDKLQEHYVYIRKHGLDMPEIRNWKWTN